MLPRIESQVCSDRAIGGDEKQIVRNDIVKADGESKPSRSRYLWSEMLRSPKHDPSFSPSLEQDSSRHGWAVVATVDRARALNHTSKQVVNMLLQVTQTYDQFATGILKAGQSLNALITTATPEAAALQEAMVFWSGETSHLSRIIKTDIVQPLQQFLQVHGESLQGIHEKYSSSRQKSCIIRSRALRARNKYVQALQEAEQAIQDWKQQEPSLSEEMPLNVKAKAANVHQKLAHYKDFVDWENECVNHCDMLEVMALETLQKLEEDRIIHFTSSLVKALAAEKHALQEVLESANQEKKTVSESIEMNDGKKTFPKFRPGLSGTISYEEGAGIMDAETLGLPIEVGELRETVRARIASRSTQARSFCVFAGFLDYVAAATERFGKRMQQILRKEETKDMGLEYVHEKMKDYERSSQLHILLGGLIRSFGVEADEAVACAYKLRTCRSEHMDKIVIYGSKLLKPASESEELVWKQLCDAARTQAKTEYTYRQTTVHQEKARVRATSLDSSKSGKAADGSSPTRVSKHLANMLSVLPNGGENAMKILAPGTVASIVQHNLDDADEKELKGRMALDSAVETTARLVEKYKRNANSWMKQFDSEDQDGWGNMRPVFDSFSETIRSSRSNMLNSLTEMDEILSKEIQACCETAANQWCSELEQMPVNLEKTTSIVSRSGLVEGYKLCCLLEKSSFVNQSLSGAQKDQPDQAFEDDVESDEDEGKDAVTSDQAYRSTQDNGGAITGPENQGPNWLRLPTIPTNSMSDSFRGKLSLRRPMTREYKRYFDVDIQTQLFAIYFSTDQIDPASLPPIIRSCPCSCKKGTEQMSSLYGLIFVSDTDLVLTSWMGNSLALQFTEVTKFEPVHEDAIAILFTTKQRDESLVTICGMQDRKEVLEVLCRLRDEAKARRELEQQNGERALQSSKSRMDAPVPPDKTLSQMEIVLHRHLRNISIQRFYEIAWSGSGAAADGKSVYQSWLEGDAIDVEIGQWKKMECTGAWDKEKYQQNRIVNFKVERKTHLYIGPPIASVQQTQCCRVEGQDKCVMAMTGECIGIPYGDSFAVEVRWVAERSGANDILVQVGIYVDFKKASLFKSKISSGTLEETTPVVERLFERIKDACLEEGGEEVPESEEESRQRIKEVPREEGIMDGTFRTMTFCLFMFITSVCFSWYFLHRSGKDESSIMEDQAQNEFAFITKRMDKLELDVKAVQDTLNEIVALLKNKQESP